MSGRVQEEFLAFDDWNLMRKILQILALKGLNDDDNEDCDDIFWLHSFVLVEFMFSLFLSSRAHRDLKTFSTPFSFPLFCFNLKELREIIAYYVCMYIKVV